MANELNFIKRVRSPTKYPYITNADGTKSTHRMAYSEADGKFYVYPTIVQKESGMLEQLDDKAAFRYAIDNREFMRFDSEDEAAAYAEGGYKQDWGIDDGSTLENFDYSREMY